MFVIMCVIRVFGVKIFVFSIGTHNLIGLMQTSKSSMLFLLLCLLKKSGKLRMLWVPKHAISLQPTFMMFTDGLVKIKTKKNWPLLAWS